MASTGDIFPFPRRSRPGDGREATAPVLRELFDRQPPNDITAEMSLLGSMIRDHTVIGDVIEVLKSGDAFYKTVHGIIFDELVHLFDRNNASDIAQLHSRLSDLGVLEDVGGDEYLLTLANSTPSTANAVHFAEIVREKHRIRQLLEAAGQILYEGYHAGQIPDIDGSAQSLLNRAEAAIFAIAEASESIQAAALKDLLHATVDDIYEKMNAGAQHCIGVPTGFFDLDRLTLGMHAGDMIIVAARPSMGKTAFALNMAQRAALRGHAVGVFSLEMTREQVATRMLSAEARVDAQKLRRNEIDSTEFQELVAACGRLGDASIYIDDTPGLSIMALRTKARRMAAQHGVKLIVIDYLQLMSGSTRESRQQEVSEISRGVKALARELRVPVVCLSQLNRGAENRESHRPRMSDLRESGSLEQDADVVILLHREDYYHQGDHEYERTNTAQIIVAKQRNGPTDTVELVWDGATTSFRDFARGMTDGHITPTAGPPSGSPVTGSTTFPPTPAVHPSPQSEPSGGGSSAPFTPQPGRAGPTPPPPAEFDPDDDSYDGLPV
jgi:replicative DNA helicase